MSKSLHCDDGRASSRAPLPSLIRHFAWLQGCDLRQSTSTQLIPSFPADRPESRSDQPCPAFPLLWYIAGHCRRALDVGNYYCYYYFYYYYYNYYYYYYYYYYYCRDPMSSTRNLTVLYGVQVLQTKLCQTHIKQLVNTLHICNNRRPSGRLPCPGWSRSARPGTDLVLSQFSRVFTQPCFQVKKNLRQKERNFCQNWNCDKCT